MNSHMTSSFTKFLSTILFLVMASISMQACSTVRSTAASDVSVTLESPPRSQEDEQIKLQYDDQLFLFAVRASSYMKKVNKNLSDADAHEIIMYVNQAAEEYGIDRHLLLAIIRIESRFNKNAASPDGAKGLTQVIPRYHKDKIVIAQRRFNGRLSLFHPGVSIFVGASVLRGYIDSSNSMSQALLKYNGSVYDPTAKYAKAVMSEYAKAKAQTV